MATKKKLDYPTLIEKVKAIKEELQQAEAPNRHDADSIIRCTTLMRTLDQSFQHRKSEAAAQDDLAKQAAVVLAKSQAAGGTTEATK